MSENGQAGGEQPKTWTPVAPPAPPPAAGTGLLVRLGIGVVALAALGFGLMQMGEGLGLLKGINAPTEQLAYRSFDPASPPQLSDPTPAIAAHLQKAAGAEVLPEDARQAIEQMLADTRPGLPQRLDDITNLVGVSSYGRHIAFDNRITFSTKMDDVGAWRKNAVAQLTPFLAGKICEPANAHVAKFMKQYNVTLWHAYTANDGNPPVFIPIPPQNCGA